jgi:hypothetical protein
MENSAATIEKLFGRIEQYSKTSFELYKYSAIYETAALFSSLAVKLIVTLIAFTVALLFTVALAMWIGDILENTAYGFLIMGMFYILLGILLFRFRKSWIKTPISNFVIKSFERPKQ